MKDEIKEILDYLKNDDYSPVFADESCDDTSYKLFDETEVKLLLDYITNLQQENERLAKLKERYQLEKEVYKLRKEKAIEYCNYNDESLYTFEPDYDYEENMVDNYEPSNFREDLLNILNGGDKE